jgi:two-component system sensor histidine kinase YesM
MFYSLKNRLIAFIVVLLVFSLGTMSYLIFAKSRSIVGSYIESSALEKMDEYQSFINMGMQQMYDVASIVFNSEITKNWDLALSDPSLAESEKILADINLSQNVLTKTTNSYSNVSSVTVYRQDGIWISTDNQIVADRSFLGEAWYQNFKNQGTHWVAAHTDAVEASHSKPYKVVSLLLPIGTFEPSLAKSVMKVNVDENFLLDPLNRIHLGETGTIFLLDQDGQPILSQNQYFDNEEAVRKVKEIRNYHSAQGVVYLKNKKGDRDILVYNKLPLNNWLLVGFVPEAELYAKLIKLRTNIIIFTTVLLIAAVLIAIWLSYGFTKPLSTLTFAMRFVQKGEFALAVSRITPKQKVNNEVGYVTETFRNMVEQLRHHIKVEFELKLLRQQAEYKALLMQINPHFLFNTLEMLSSLAMQRRTDDTVAVIVSLGKMMRFSLKISNDLVPVEEEGNLELLEIVKFILQPLVENAVKYSFVQQTVAEVSIRICNELGQVQLIVADNGPGMPAALVQRLYAESGVQQFDQILNNATIHIGLRNVLARCQLYYGSLFSFTIDSREGLGTTITLILPAQEGTRDV